MNNAKQVGSVSRYYICFFADMFMMGKVRKLREVRRSVITKDQRPVSSLIVVRVFVSIDLFLNGDKFPKMENGAINEVNLAAQESGVGAAFVVIYLARKRYVKSHKKIVYCSEILINCHDNWAR